MHVDTRASTGRFRFVGCTVEEFTVKNYTLHHSSADAMKVRGEVCTVVLNTLNVLEHL